MFVNRDDDRDEVGTGLKFENKVKKGWMIIRNK